MNDESGNSTERWCDGCEDETPHRQIGDSSAPGPTYQCLVCPERIEIEAAIGMGDSGRNTGTDGGGSE